MPRTWHQEAYVGYIFVGYFPLHRRLLPGVFIYLFHDAVSRTKFIQCNITAGQPGTINLLNKR